jgi:hypothetical protein
VADAMGLAAGRLAEAGAGVEAEAVAAVAGRAVAELEGVAAVGRGADDAAAGPVDVPAGRTVEEK